MKVQESFRYQGLRGEGFYVRAQRHHLLGLHVGDTALREGDGLTDPVDPGLNEQLLIDLCWREVFHVKFGTHCASIFRIKPVQGSCCSYVHVCSQGTAMSHFKSIPCLLGDNTFKKGAPGVALANFNFL